MPGCDASTMSVSEPSSSQLTQLDNDDITVIGGPASSSQLTANLSTALLQTEEADCKAERKTHHNNGNKAPQVDKPNGKNLDPTCLKLAIEWPGVTKGGRKVSYYYCIACDEFCANNSWQHAFEHAEDCGVHVVVEFLLYDGLTSTVCLTETQVRLARISKRGGS